MLNVNVSSSTSIFRLKTTGEQKIYIQIQFFSFDSHRHAFIEEKKRARKTNSCCTIDDDEQEHVCVWQYRYTRDENSRSRTFVYK